LLAALDLPPLAVASLLFQPDLSGLFGILPQFSHRAPGRFGIVALRAAPPCREAVLERPFGLLPFTFQEQIQDRLHLIPGQGIDPSLHLLPGKPFVPQSRAAHPGARQQVLVHLQKFHQSLLGRC